MLFFFFFLSMFCFFFGLGREGTICISGEAAIFVFFSLSGLLAWLAGLACLWAGTGGRGRRRKGRRDGVVCPVQPM
ncbi:hypothetical protein GGR50DRAFT_669575 [Xylaria sp. CBS 124048]|nr:hypothetical protein GGR50DRAFT_669575 [Xylaria sp. CBS 124048]